MENVKLSVEGMVIGVGERPEKTRQADSEINLKSKIVIFIIFIKRGLIRVLFFFLSFFFKVIKNH